MPGPSINGMSYIKFFLNDNQGFKAHASQAEETENESW